MKNFIKLLLALLSLTYVFNISAQGLDCANAVPATLGINTTTGPISGTAELVCPFPEAANFAGWYEYTPTGNRTLTVASCLGGVDTRLMVSSGTCVSQTCVASSDDECEMTQGGNSYASSVTFIGLANTTYYIQWDDRWSVEGFQWTLTETDLDCPVLALNIGDECNSGSGVVSDACECVALTAPSCATLIAPANEADVMLDPVGDIDLSWSLNGFLPIEEVNLYFGSDSDNLSFLVSIPPASTEVTITNVTVGTYYWQAVPSNSAGEAENCQILSFTVVESPTIHCPTLTSPANTASGIPAVGNIVAVSWNNPTMGVPATQNGIYFSEDPSALNFLKFVDGSVSTTTLTGLSNGVTYYWTVVPQSGSAVAENCTVFSFTTLGDSFCPSLGLSVNDICDDGDPSTVFDVVLEDCTCGSAQNISCETATVIHGDGIYPNNFIAPGSGGASNSCFGDNMASDALWFTYIPEEDGTAIITSSVDEDLPDTRLSVYVQGSCGNFECLTSDDNSGTGPTSEVKIIGVVVEAIFMLEWDNRWSNGPFDFEIIEFLDVDLDGIADSEDNCPSTYNPDQEDIDGDGEGDVCDNDQDNDGDADDVDCDPQDPSIFFGASCDDGNPLTENDIVQADCSCLGTFIDGTSCINPIELSSLGGNFGSFSFVGVNTASNNCLGNGATDAIWFEYFGYGELGCESEVTISASNIGSAPAVSVYTGICGDLVCIGSNIGGTGNSTEVSLQVIAQTYYIEVDDRWGSGSFDLDLSVALPGCDTDGDGVIDFIDNCPIQANPAQQDMDSDGAGDACDNDIDGDGFLNENDCDPMDATIFLGASCDDGDPNTADDEIQANCACEGFLLPDNYICANAIPISDGTHFGNGPSGGSGATNICPDASDAGENATWYSYTSYGDGHVTINSCLGGADTQVSVFTGDCENLVCVAANDDTCPMSPSGSAFASEVIFFVIEGTEYLIQWDDQWSQDSFEFMVSCDCSGIDSDGDGFGDSNDNCPLTVNSDQADFDGDGIGDVCDNDIDGDGVVNVDDCAEMNPLIYPGAPCDDGNPTTAGDVIQADCTCAGPPILNSICDGAIEVSEGTSIATGPVIPGGSSNLCPDAADAGDAASWYQYTAFCDGEATISSCGGGVDTQLSIFTGPCDNLTCIVANDDICPVSEGGSAFASEVIFAITAGTEYLIQWDNQWSDEGFEFNISFIGCGFDTDGDGIGDFEDNCPLFANANQADNDGDGLGDVCDDDDDNDGDLDADDCDHLDAAVYFGAPCDDGDVSTLIDVIEADCSCVGIPGPANIYCSGAVVISEGSYSDLGPSYGGGSISLCPDASDAGDNASWYSYSPSCDGVANVNSCGGGEDTQLSIFTGPCANLTCVVASEDACSVAPDGSGNAFASEVYFEATVGTDYLIQWDDQWSSAPFTFSVSIVCSEDDIDADGIADADDNCPSIVNTEQEDSDEDGLGNACDDDDDNDGVLDAEDCDPLDPLLYLGATCDDGDCETINDAINVNCICEGENSHPPDTDGDGISDNCDDDIDGDGVLNEDDCDPYDNTLYLGASCDDGNEETVDDVIIDDCMCSGVVATGNLSCEAAIVVSIGTHSDPGPTSGTSSDLCPDAADAGDNASWYLYTSQYGGEVTISSCGGGVDTQLAVFTGSCEDLQCVAANDDSCPMSPDGTGSLFASEVIFYSIPGTEYFIQWDDQWSQSGFDFTIDENDWCDLDTDFDGTCDLFDNCYDIPNFDQLDTDGDFYGDVCDPDMDGDGVLNENDCAPLFGAIYVGATCDDGNPETETDVILEDCTCNGTNADQDSDAVADIVDNCPQTYNPNQEDIDGDGIGDSCDEDADNDGVLNNDDCNPLDATIYVGADCDDGDPFTLFDTIDDECVCEGILYDHDYDGIVNSLDNCLIISNTDQSDIDEDGIGDVCDDDIDGDGFANDEDCDPNDGAVFIGALCNDGDVTTTDDVIDGNCLCVGVLNTCPTDFNNDGITDGEDFSIFLGNYNQNCPDPGTCPTDLNNDGITNGEDFAIYLGNYGLDCPPTE